MFGKMFVGIQTASFLQIMGLKQLDACYMLVYGVIYFNLFYISLVFHIAEWLYDQLASHVALKQSSKWTIKSIQLIRFHYHNRFFMDPL